MVNRILIRLKVVQLLYAYLLTRTEFKIETDPDVSSADKKFAFEAYIDLLSLLLKVTGHNSPLSNAQIHKKLVVSAVAKALEGDSELRHLIFKADTHREAISAIVADLHKSITTSSAFLEYSRKRKTSLEDEINLWKVLVETTFLDDKSVMAAFRAMDGYSSAGMKMAVDKVLATLNSYFDARAGYMHALKSLERSLDMSHKLYISMFVLIVRLTQARESQLEAAKNKYLATARDKNPNTRFVDNRLAAALANSPELQDFISKYAIDWTDDITLLNSLLESITTSSVYQQYMEAPSTDWETDCEFWRSIFKNVIFLSDDLTEALEADSVFWNDDLHIIGTFVLKTLRIDARSETQTPLFLPQFKDAEDSEFGANLFDYAVKNRDEYYSYIERFIDTKNWESDRIAFMDVVILLSAIAEIINFVNIPVAVSFNEYIEIANLYSTSKSGQFVNGILHSVVELLRQEGIVVKQ